MGKKFAVARPVFGHIHGDKILTLPDLERSHRLFGRTGLGRTSGLRALAFAVTLALVALGTLAGPVSATESDQLKADLEAARQTIESLRSELTKTNQDRADLQRQLETTRGEIARSLEELFASTTWKTDPEVVVLRGKLDAAGKQIKVLATVAEGSKAETAAAKDKLLAANSKIESLTADKKDALSKISKLKDNLTAARTSTAETATLRKNLERAEGNIRVLRTKLEKANLSAADAAADKKDALSKISKLKDSLAAARTSTAETTTLRKNLQRAEKNIQTLRTKLEKAEVAAADAKGMRAALRQARLYTDDLELKLGTLGEERKGLKTQLDNVQGDVAQRIERVFAKASEAANRESADLRAKLEASGTENARLLAVSKQASAKEQKLKDQVASLRQDKAGLETALATAEQNGKQVAARLGDLGNTQEDLRRVLQAATEKTKATAIEATTLRKQVEDARQRIEALTAQEKAAKDEKDALAQKFEQAQQQVQAARAKADSAAKVAARAVRASASKSDALREQLATSKRELDRIKAELASVRENVRSASDENYKRIEDLIVAAAASPDPELTDLKAKLAMAEEEIARLSAALGERSPQLSTQ